MKCIKRHVCMTELHQSPVLTLGIGFADEIDLIFFSMGRLGPLSVRNMTKKSDA